jgi:hypothetical protein
MKSVILSTLIIIKIFMYKAVETDYSKMQENYLQTLSITDILKFNNFKL